MDPKKRIDKILASVHEQVREEVATLLGVKMVISDTRADLVSKEKFFENLLGKQILAKIDVAGELEGVGCLVIGIKDAIRLGGTLIMLPDSELEEVVGREEYTEETEDSYGEIANIIAGSYTKVFEESYPKSCRFIRKEQEVLIPVKVDVESDEPVPNQSYYQVSCTLQMGDLQMGDLHMLMPAEPFGLAAKMDDAAASAAEPEPESPQPVEENVADQPETEMEPETAVQDESPPSGAESAGQAKKRKYDPVKHKKRVDRLLEFCEEKLSEELSALLGVTIKCSDHRTAYFSKEEFFHEEAEGKQIFADFEVIGDLHDRSYCSISLKDAIHLGGVLIMLPPSELEVVIAEEDFSDDLKDSYGEVANIIAGVYTAVFEEQYSEKIRFVKKEIDMVLPMKVDVETDEPCKNQQYYVSSMSLNVEGKQLGKLRMLFPSEMLGISTAVEAEEPSPEVQPAVKPEPAKVQEETVQESPPPSEPAPAAGPPFDAAKHKKKVDKLLKECQKVLKGEVGALLDSEVKLENLENRLVSKEEFFYDVANGKQVMARLNVVGELEDTSYLFVTLKDAIHMGGLLIMLPPAELEAAVTDEEFNEDCSDAYSEIANIISGVYTGVFEEQYTKKIRFVRSDVEKIIPMKVDVESDEPVPDQEYYLSTMSLSIDDKQLGDVSLLFPAKMLQVDGAAQQVADTAAAQEVAQSTQQQDRAEQGVSGQPTGTVAPSDRAPVDILIVSDDEGAAGALAECASQRGYGSRKISFKDDVRGAITSEVKVVYIVMRSVDERAFGMIIKINTSCSKPIVAAGPAWTRSKVIKAVKYGVTDILLTPASGEDIFENLENNLVRLAA